MVGSHWTIMSLHTRRCELVRLLAIVCSSMCCSMINIMIIAEGIVLPSTNHPPTSPPPPPPACRTLAMSATKNDWGQWKVVKVSDWSDVLPFRCKMVWEEVAWCLVTRRAHSAHLVTSRAPRLQSLRVVTAAVQLSVLVEVDEVHQQLL